MTIKWSAVKVSEAMDEVEGQVVLAGQFIDEAKSRAEQALKIENIPDYMAGSINRLIYQLERMKDVNDSISTVRKNIPDGAVEAELNAGKHGNTNPML